MQNPNIKTCTQSKRQNLAFGASIIEPEVKQLIRAHMPDFGGSHSVCEFISEPFGQRTIKTILSNRHKSGIFQESLTKLRLYILKKKYPHVAINLIEMRTLGQIHPNERYQYLAKICSEARPITLYSAEKTLSSNKDKLLKAQRSAIYSDDNRRFTAESRLDLVKKRIYKELGVL